MKYTTGMGAAILVGEHKVAMDGVDADNSLKTF